MSSMQNVALSVLRRCRRKEIPQTELIRTVAEITGFTSESVRGTIIGGGRKLFGTDEFKKTWVVCQPDKALGKPKRFVQRRYRKATDVEFSLHYDTPSKKEARERGMKDLKPGRQKIITLAATEGYCVKEILRRCPQAEIINIERDADILAQWKRKGITTTNIHSTLLDFVFSPRFLLHQYSFLNADLMGYPCPSLHKMLERVNMVGNIQTIALNTLGLHNFRNHSEWKTKMEARYRSTDPTRQWLVALMSNYRIVDEWFYNRDPEHGSHRMRMFVLQRRVNSGQKAVA